MLRVRTSLNGFVGGPGLMTLYFTSADENDATAARVRARVHALFTSGFKTAMWNTASWTVNPDVDRLDPANGEITSVLTGAVAHTGNGTGGANAAPIASAALVRWQTATHLGGRRLRGRTFLSPLSTSAVDATGTLADITRGVLDGHLATYLIPPTEGDKAVVWHRPVEGTGGAAGDITSATMADKLGVLTSRRD